MKKKIIGIFVSFLLVLPVISIAKLEKIQQENVNLGVENLSDSHTVIVEFGSLSTSSQCSTASNQLYEIYSSGIYNFYYVTLVADENEAAENRLQELGISGFPEVFFDGGYTHVFGEQSNTDKYIDAIVECLLRDVYPVEIYLDAYWTSSPCFPEIIVTVEVINGENSEYHGRLLVSIVEINSRWKDYIGRPYSYALLDYAADEDIYIDPLPLGKYTARYVWFPNVPGCGKPNDPNLLVMVSVFSDSTGFADATVVSRLVDGDQPTKPYKPDGPVKVKMGEKYSYSTRSSDPDDDKIKYGWDWDGDYNIDEWTDYYDSGEEIIISHIWNEKGNYAVRVKAKDEAGLESFWSDPLTVTMPRNRLINRPFLTFLQQSFPNLFSILRLSLLRLGLQS